MNPVFPAKYLRLIPAALVLLLAVGAKAETTNTLSGTEMEGRKLAQQLCETRPAENFTNTGILKIRDGAGKRLEPSLTVETVVAADHWKTIYSATLPLGKDRFDSALTVTHSVDHPNIYHSTEQNLAGHFEKNLAVGETMIPFASSDFWVADLGLEFLHWPAQKILKKEFHDNCASIVLESMNPNPATNGYARVVSRIEEDSGGLMEATTYDLSGRPLKEFRVKSLKKINGQWQVESVIMENIQTGSRTRLEFDLKAK